MISNTFLFVNYSLPALSYRQMSIFCTVKPIWWTHTPNSLIMFAKLQTFASLTVGWKWLFRRCTATFLSVYAPVCYRDTADLAEAGGEQQMNPSSANDTHCLHWSAACTEHIGHGFTPLVASRSLWKHLASRHCLCFLFALLGFVLQRH